MQKATLDEYFGLLTTTHSTNLVREYLHLHPEVLQQNPLSYAIFANRKDVVELLIELGVDINERDAQGRTALRYAVSNRRIKIVELLIAKNALHHLDNEGKGPLQIALMDPEYLVLPMLLESYSADLNLDDVVAIVQNLNMPVKIRHAAYLYLVAKAPVALLRELAKDMDFNYVDSKGNGAVLVACQAGNTDALIWLCRSKAQPLSLDVRNLAGDCPVLTATAHGQRDLLMDCLLKPVASGGCGLSIHARNIHTNNNAVRTAVANGHVELMKELGQVSKSSKRFVHDMEIAIEAGQTEILALLVKPVRKGGYGLSVSSLGKSAIELAIKSKQKRLLRELVRPKSEGGFGCSFAVISIYNFVIDKPEMLLALVRPVAQGGHGMVFKECEKYYAKNQTITYRKLQCIRALINAGERELLTDYIAAVYLNKQSIQFVSDLADDAIAKGHTEILADLVSPFAQGGLGIILDYNSIYFAIKHNRNQILLKLIKPIKDGGFGVKMDLAQIMQYALCQSDDIPLEAIFVLLMDHFDKFLIENGINAAITWVKNTPIYTAISLSRGEYPAKDLRMKRSIEFKMALTDHYKELIALNIKNENTVDAQKIVSALEEISPGEGLLCVAEISKKTKNYVAAFQNYLAAYHITNLPSHEAVGCELANMILTGNVVLTQDGILCDISKLSLDFDMDVDIMQDRAIKAYRYLHGGQSEMSVELRNCLDQILAGNMCNPYDIGKVIWQHEALIKFHDYYAETTPEMLNEPACRASQAHANQVLREFMTTQAAKQEPSPSRFSPRFAMPADRPKDPNQSGSKDFKM